MNNRHHNRALSAQELENRRVAAGKLFTRGKTAYFIEKKFGISSTTAREWRTRWKEGTLKARREGCPSKLSDKQKKTLSALIQKGPQAAGYETELWTLSRLTELVRKRCSVSYRPRSLWHLIRALGFSCQKPARKAKERDEKAISRWTKKEWPALLKKGLCSA
jgi:transposase